jgi:hypothetical protein
MGWTLRCTPWKFAVNRLFAVSAVTALLGLAAASPLPGRRPR